jgi:hypothetical protein
MTYKTITPTEEEFKSWFVKLKITLSDDHRFFWVKFFDVDGEVEAFKEAFRLCVLHHGLRGPEKAEWTVGSVLDPDTASDVLGREGWIGWKMKEMSNGSI